MGPLFTASDAIMAEVHGRIIKANYGQRSRVRKANGKICDINASLPFSQKIALHIIEDFNIIELFEEQEWACQCHRVAGHDGCFQYVDVEDRKSPGRPVIGHINNLANGGNHTRSNIGVMRHECNQHICDNIEKQRSAKVNRISASHRGVKANGKAKAAKQPNRFSARSWGPQRGFKGQPKRKMQGRRFNGDPILRN